MAGFAFVPIDMTADMMRAFLRASGVEDDLIEVTVAELGVGSRQEATFIKAFRAACLAAPQVPPVEPDFEDMRDAALFRFWLRMINTSPGAMARALAPCATADQHRAALTALARRLGVNLPGL